MNAGSATPGLASRGTLERRLQRALAANAERPGRRIVRPLLPPELAGFSDQTAIPRLRSAAVLLPIINRSDELKLLLTRRAESLRKHGGQISFPGGACDPDDANEVATALRESREEVGLEPHQAQIIGHLDDYPTVTGFCITPVVALISDAFSPRPVSPSEVAEVFEMPLQVVLEPGNYTHQTYERDGVVVPYLEINYGSHRIWGATAGILHDLCLRVAENA